jgi:hypothetical protein
MNKAGYIGSMLEHLFGSRTRVKLISLFLTHPDEPVFVREVTRMIGTQINAVRRELSNLASFGLIVETAEADDGAKRPGLKRKYYRLNANFPLLTDIRSLMTKAQLLVENRIDRMLVDQEQVRFVALMGGFIGQTNAPVDLFMIGIVEKPILTKMITAMELALGREVNYTIMTPSEYQYRKEIADKFLIAILNAPKNIVLDRMDDPKLRSSYGVAAH